MLLLGLGPSIWARGTCLLLRAASSADPACYPEVFSALRRTGGRPGAALPLMMALAKSGAESEEVVLTAVCGRTCFTVPTSCCSPVSAEAVGLSGGAGKGASGLGTGGRAQTL